MNQENRKNGPSPAASLVAFFSSTKLTLVLLALIAFLSFFGTTGREFNLIGFHLDFRGDTLYRSIPFQLLLGLLFTNLLVCTIDKLPGAWKRFKMDSGPEPPAPPASADQVVTFLKADIDDALSKAEKYFFGQGAKPIRAERELFRKVGPGKDKGNDGEKEKAAPEKVRARVSFLSRGGISVLGPQITHVGILILIVGGIIGGRGHFEAEMKLRPGEQKSEAGVAEADSMRPVDLGFTVRCNDFQVTYYDDSPMASDYLCDLSILADGREVKRHVIEVNRPLHYKGYGFYQAKYDYEPTIRYLARSLQTGDTLSVVAPLGEPVELPGGTYMAIDFEEKTVGMGRDLGPSLTLGWMKDGQMKGTARLFQNFPDRDQAKVEGYQISFVAMPGQYATILQIIKDPGIPLVWTGCSLLVLGVMVSFFIRHQRVWIVASKRGDGVIVEIAGRAKKGQALFAKRLAELADELVKENAKAAPPE